MLRTKKEFLKISKQMHFIVVGEFLNEYNEEYIIFKLTPNKYLIAGDETNWDIYQLHSQGIFAYKEFIFNVHEITEIRKIITKDGLK